MIRRFILFVLIIISFESLSGIQRATAQTDTQMFMFQIDGNNYNKKSYDKAGRLKTSQIFKVGRMKKDETQFQLQIKIYEYDKNGRMEDSSSTTFTCKPSESLILMNIFPFADISSNKTVEVELKNGDHIYPSIWKVGEKIQDHSYSLTIEGGLLAAVGTKSNIKVFDRQVTASDKAGNSYTISSKAQIKSYMFGLNVSTLNFSIEEIIDPNIGIISQQFTEESGEYFIINLQNP